MSIFVKSTSVTFIFEENGLFLIFMKHDIKVFITFFLLNLKLKILTVLDKTFLPSIHFQITVLTYAF